MALAGLAVVWQIASFFVPHFLFPSVPEIAERLFAIFTSWRSISDALATSARILAGLAGAFVLGTHARHADGAFGDVRALRLSAA